jgi:hypothetical protein
LTISIRFGRKLHDDNPIAFKREAGHQVDLLMPGMRMKWWLVFTVSKFSWVQIQAGEIGGAYLLNPFLVGGDGAHVGGQPRAGCRHQVIHGMPTLDTSGEEFKFGNQERAT